MQLYNFGSTSVIVIKKLRLQINSTSSILGRSEGGKLIFLIRKVQI